MVSFTIGQAQADNSIGSPSLRRTAGDHKADRRHSSEVFIEVHRREEERWTINTFEAGDTIILESLDIQFPIEDVYGEPVLLTSHRGLCESEFLDRKKRQI